jgi:D-3-phosphoglycerate dehydrogenase
MARLKVGVPVGAFNRYPALRAELLEHYPDAKLHEEMRTLSEDEVIAFLADRDAAIIGKEPMTERVLDALPNLKLISKWGAGCETLDLDSLQRRGIRFAYEPGPNKLAVAELALCYMIVALRWVAPLNRAMLAGERPHTRIGRSLTGRVVGIHGCGNIGKEIVRLLKPLNCEILACDIVDYADFYRANGVTPVSFPELLARSEVITLHLPLTRETTNLYDAAALERMRPDAVLINTCRGGIVDERVLIERLKSEKLVAACFDVLAIEPATNDELLQLRNFLATPHIGASTDQARMSMGRAAINGLLQNEAVPA